MNRTKAITATFDFHVDPLYFNFQWSEAQYITVEYSALNREGEVVASAYTYKASPWLLASISMRGHWMTVDKEITAAAQDHAAKEFARNGHIDQTILSALMPHI